MTALSKELSKWRKKRPISQSLASVETIQSYALLGLQPLHKTTAAGITACDIMPGRPSVVATGGVDTQVFPNNFRNAIVSSTKEHFVTAPHTGNHVNADTCHLTNGFGFVNDNPI